MTNQKVRIGMVGGGSGAGIAPVHRFALRMDNRFELVAGAFSRSAEINRETSVTLGVAEDRVYGSAEEMADAESNRNDGIQIVSIVTPHHVHLSSARPFLERKIHVICEKPITGDLEEALVLQRLAREEGLIFALTHNYSGYGMIRHAASMVRNGLLGEVRLVQVEHASGWAAAPVEKSGRKQAVWRTDPNQAGEASVMLDLGTHAHHLLRFVTGLEVSDVSADLSTTVPDRQIFDNAQVTLKLSNGARGSLWACMAATGHEHGLRLRVYGTKASLEWMHEDPQHLQIRHLGGRKETLAMGQSDLSDEARALMRIGLGHPEGFLESFANIYTEVADAVQKASPSDVAAGQFRFPTSEDGVAGLAFVEAVMRSNAQGGSWQNVSVPA